MDYQGMYGIIQVEWGSTQKKYFLSDCLEINECRKKTYKEEKIHRKYYSNQLCKEEVLGDFSLL